MSDEEINKIICLNIDKVDIPNELYNAIIFMRDRFFQEKEKNKYLIGITHMYNAYEVNNENTIIVADKEYFDMGLFARKFINKDEIKEISNKYENAIENSSILTRLNQFDLLRAVINDLDDLIEE